MEQLDPQAVSLAKAVRQTESGGDFSAKGKSGEYGAYQFTPDTWAAQSQKYLNRAVPLNAATPEEQNQVAYSQIKEWKDSGKNVGQIASMWNAGQGEPDAYTGKFSNGAPSIGVNKFGVKYDVPKYATSVATAYQKIKQGQDVQADPNNPSSVVNTQPAEQPVGFLQSLVRGIANPFMREGANLVNAAQMISGKPVDPNSSVNYGDYLGSAKPVGQEGDFSQRVKDAIGTGASMASNLTIPEASGTIKATTIGGKILHGALTGAKAGATAGALYGGGEALQNNESLGNTAVKGVEGGIIGGATGGMLGGALGVPMAGKNFVKPSDAKIFENRTSALDDVIHNNAPLRALDDNAKKQGINMSEFISQHNLLTDSVDKDGTIFTKKAGGAVEKMQEFMQPAEQVVKANLEREGVHLTPQNLMSQVETHIMDSGLTGAKLTTALDAAKKEIAGLQLQSKGNIPLALVHQAKANLYKDMPNAYLQPQAHVVDKTVAKALKKVVEKNSDIPVGELNGELAKYISITKLLNKLDGKKVKGGRLGKYFAQTLGGVMGNTVGGPVGGILGAEGATAIHGKILERSLSGGGILGKEPALPMTQSKLMKGMIEKAKSPKEVLPALPAPKVASKESVIPLSGKTLPNVVVVGGKKPPINYGEAINRKSYEERRGLLRTSKVEQPTKTIKY